MPAATLEAHRIMVRRMIEESSFEAVLDLISDEVAPRAGLAKTPTLKQLRYRRLAIALAPALATAIMERV